MSLFYFNIFMKVFYQRSDNKWYEIEIFKSKNIWYRSVVKNLTNKVIDNIFLENEEIKWYYLLDEKFFKFYCFNIFVDLKEKILDIWKLNKIINEKKEFVRTYFWEKRKLLYVLIDNVFVNSQKCDYVLGKSWKIFFDLLFIYIDDILYDVLNRKSSKIIEMWYIWPESFFTIKFLRDNFLKRDFNILYFFDDYIKLVKVEKGFYKFIDFLDLGYNKLISFYKDKDIVSLFYRYKKWKNLNFIWEKLVEEVLNFYFSFIEKWLLEKDLINWQFVAIGVDLFWKVFIPKFFSSIKVIPFNHSIALDKKVKIKHIPIDVKTFLFYKM